MLYKFHACGNPNILATHKTALEFTKDRELTLKGDCIVGVNSDFQLSRIKEFIESLKNNKITITIKGLGSENQETIEAEINQSFNSDNELIIRKTDFASERTFAISSNKAAFELKRDLIGFLKGKKNRIEVVLKNRQ